MRRCPVCKLAPRAHDPMWQVQILAGDLPSAMGWPSGGYAVCHECLREGFPERCGALAIPLPSISTALGSWWCAVCENYAREDDPIAQHNACLRVLQEDLDARPELWPRPRPGALRCCAECWAIWGPVVQTRWERDKIVPAGLPLAALGFNMV